MNDKLKKAIALLKDQRCSCVIYENDKNYRISNEIGIKPLMMELRENKDAFAHCVIADKVIGKAAALLTVLGKADAVYGKVMSENAKEYFDHTGMEYSYDELVPYIANRTKDGRCPMEETVCMIDSPTEAFEALEHTIARLMANKHSSIGE